MHDLRKLVAPGRKEDPREQEIVSELAGHLEEMYIDLRRAGASEEQAIAQVTAMGKNLGPSIRRLRWQYEGGLRTWLRSVVLPGLVLFFFYGACSSLSFDIYWGRQSVWREASTELIAIALGFCAAFFSRELGGNLSQRRWAGMSIIAPYAGVWCVLALLVAPLQLVQWSAYRRPGAITGAAVSFLWVLLRDVVLPGLGLALGGVISARAFPGIESSKPKREIA
jgi:hypothetical protein